MAVATVGAAALATMACDPSPPDEKVPCSVSFLGTDAAAPRLQIIVVQPDDSIVAAVDGGMVSLMTPPQGGRVIFAGAKATNVDGCGVQLTGSIRDLDSGQVKVDSRTINLVPTGDGWGASGVGMISGTISNFANIAVCPNQTFAKNVYGQPFALEVDLVDRDGRTAKDRIVVTPECDEPANLATCMCTCAAHYVLGQPCPADGG